jgi:formiminotetrahydrofolate cyclodeaminase
MRAVIALVSFQHESLQQFLGELSAHTSTPGGGTVAALAAAMATSLGAMVASFSQGEKYNQVRSMMMEIEQACQGSRDRFLLLADHDADAFKGLLAASRLPADPGGVRLEALQAALKIACQVPERLGEEILSLQQRFRLLREQGNRHLLSDVGAALSLFGAALEISSLNMRINLRQMNDEQDRQDRQATVEMFLRAATLMRKQVSEIHAQLKGEETR